MKKYCIVLILFFAALNAQTVADEISSDNGQPIFDPESMFDLDRVQTLLEGSLRVFFPYDDDIKMLSFFDFAYGWNYNIIKNIISPGILFDIAIGTDWFWLFSDKEEENKFESDKKENRVQFGFSCGIRFYNMIEFFDFKIVPFIGCNFSFFLIPILDYHCLIKILGLNMPIIFH